ncbi:MAG TPA: COX15/CtaA family protein, partial [Xylella taiwanensis]
GGVALALRAVLEGMLGVLDVRLAVPLVVGVMHNGAAVALVFVLVSLLARLRAPE